MKVAAPILLFALVSILSGCASTYRDPKSIGLPPSQMAVLEQRDEWDSRVFISEVNGRDRGTGIFTRFELPPGRNTVLVTGNTHGGMYANETELAFVAEAGRVYELKYEASPRAHLLLPSTWKGPGTWRAWIVDKVTAEAIDEDSLRQKKKPNQTLEPTPTAGTSAAEQPLVPAAVVAHL